MSEEAIELVKIPKDVDYEEYICSYFQAGGLYVEKNIILRETEELLELDIISSDFKYNKVDKNLIEIKSGGWGFNEIFKVKGWLVYLKMDKGAFIVQNTRPSQSYFEGKARDLSIDLIDNSDLSNTEENLSDYIIQEIDENAVETIRFSYLLERKMIKKIKILKKNYPEIESYKCLDDYFFKVNSGSFFSNNPVKRIKQLFRTFLKYKNITAKICHELTYGEYDEEVEELDNDCFTRTFYNAEDNILQISLHIEHICRVTILKSCIEHLIINHRSDFREPNFLEKIEYLSLPSTIKSGLEQIVREEYFHRYPIFWQWFTYVMGGFILTDFKDEEYKYIADNTGIPVDQIPKAFDSYNKLFPKSNGWFFKLPKSNIEWHRFFSLPLCGLGANHRRSLYLEDGKDSYEDLGEILSGSKTMDDLLKWNNLAYKILK